MTILEHVLDSSNSHCNDIVSNHSSAGANACSSTNAVLTTAPPFYELVWSKQKGLSHKSASSSLAEKKASVLWSTEAFNVVVSSPISNCEGKRSAVGEVCKHELNSLQSGSQIEDKYSKKVTPIGSPRSTCGPQRCSATTEPSTKKEQMSNLDVHNESNHQTTLECSEEVNEKYKCCTPCLGIALSFQEPTLAKDITPTNISSASTSRDVLPMDVARRMKFEKVVSHHRNLVGKFVSTFNYNRKASELKKDKEPIIHDLEDVSSSSNRRENGHDDFECISSRGLVSTVKRARICDSESEKLIGGKKLKTNGKCSFMNWVTTITNGLTIPSKDVPMEFFQHPSLQVKGITSPFSILDKKKEVNGISHGIRGFESIFQDMYFPAYSVSRNKVKYVDNQKELVALRGTKSEKQDSCAELMKQGGHSFPRSLWIMRHTLSLPSPVSVQCSDHRHSYVEAQTNRWSTEPQHNSGSHTEKPKSKLQLTLSSKYCKRSEPMSSTFAKRLDSLINTTASKNVDEYTGANKICLFCGMSDHSITECTEVVETRLEHYLKTKPLYNRIKKSSYFCILCFHLDHWAASCPNAPSKGNKVSCNANGFDDFNIRNSAQKHQNHNFTNHDGAIMLWSGNKDHHQVARSKNSDFVVSTNISRQNESECCGTLDLDVIHAGDATKADTMEVTAVFPSQNEVKRSEVTPFSSQLSTKIASEPESIFVFVRKLRLSRADIIRWMKSSTPHVNLIGFFLRLRIGKLEKGFSGTRYHVACINGSSSHRSIFVCVGRSTYSVTSRFISNQDFNEDELNTWWFQTLRDGTKMPSSEELNEKLQLKEKI